MTPRRGLSVTISWLLESVPGTIVFTVLVAALASAITWLLVR